jgi:DNA-binding XRE family transcriptional regulator
VQQASWDAIMRGALDTRARARERAARSVQRIEASRRLAEQARRQQARNNPDGRTDSDGTKNPLFPTNIVANPATVANSATYATEQGLRPSGPMVADVAELNQRIARNLRVARLEEDLTQEALGRRMGVRRNEVNAYENGRRKITPLVLVRAAQALDRDPSWFTLDHPIGDTTG